MANDERDGGEETTSEMPAPDLGDDVAEDLAATEEHHAADEDEQAPESEAPDTENGLDAPAAATEPEPADSDEQDIIATAAPDADADADGVDLESTSDFMVASEELSYVPQAPMITSMRPTIADSRGGTAITVFGAGFVGGCSVFMGDSEMVAEVIDPFTLRFVAPEALGKRGIFVQAASGTRSPTELELSFVPGPAIRQVIPAEGPVEGGVHVIIEGDRFKTGASLSIFGVHAPELEIESDERASFKLPPAGEGPLEGEIVITNRDGLSGRSETAFRYRPLEPVLSRIEPDYGWVSGGKIVSLHGRDFHPMARVVFGNTETLVRFRDMQTLDVEVPEYPEEGPVDVLLLHPDGKEVLLSQAFRYQPVPAPPKIIDVIPRAGATTGGATVRIVGDNFTDEVVVRIGEVTAVRKVLSAKLIDAELPPRSLPGLVAIEMVHAGVVIRAEDAFTYASPKAPVIKHVEPRGGPIHGGTKVLIEGENFPANASVRFGSETAKKVIVRNETQIETEAPAQRAASAVDVIVSSPETGPGMSKAGYRYEVVAAPSISGVAPPKGTTDGGTEISIEGKNFAEGVIALIGDVPVKVRRISGSVLEVHTPEGQDGKLVDVVVKNPDGQKAIQKRAFQYDARYRS